MYEENIFNLNISNFDFFPLTKQKNVFGLNFKSVIFKSFQLFNPIHQILNRENAPAEIFSKTAEDRS